jgi:uncharacterized protein with NRDE domain
MCVFSVAYRVFSDCPIFVLTNRDESTERPTLSPRIFSPARPGGSRWFGGADERAGGTWLGVNERGLLAAVTNRRTAAVPANPRSRGLLCRDVLERGDDSAAKALELVLAELREHEYAGFNLILLSAQSALVVERADDFRIRELEPGIHTIGNGHLDDAADRRVQRAQRLVTALLEQPGREWAECVEGAKDICRIHAVGDEPGICLHGAGWGTVGSTIVGLALDVRSSRYHYAAGPPCRTPHIDCSSAFRQLFTPPAVGA